MKTHLKGISLEAIKMAKANGKTAYFIEGHGKKGIIRKDGSRWFMSTAGKPGMTFKRPTRRQAIAAFAVMNQITAEVIS